MFTKLSLAKDCITHETYTPKASLLTEFSRTEVCGCFKCRMVKLGFSKSCEREVRPSRKRNFEESSLAKKRSTSKMNPFGRLDFEEVCII